MYNIYITLNEFIETLVFFHVQNLTQFNFLIITHKDIMVYFPLNHFLNLTRFSLQS